MLQKYLFLAELSNVEKQNTEHQQAGKQQVGIEPTGAHIYPNNVGLPIHPPPSDKGSAS